MSARDAVRTAVRRQWPILAVSLIFLVAFALVIAGYWRRGALVIGIGVGVAAVLRLILSENRAGLLVVRHRATDFTMLAVVSAAVCYTAWTIDPLGTS